MNSIALYFYERKTSSWVSKMILAENKTKKKFYLAHFGKLCAF